MFNLPAHVVGSKGIRRVSDDVLLPLVENDHFRIASIVGLAPGRGITGRKWHVGRRKQQWRQSQLQMLPLPRVGVARPSEHNTSIAAHKLRPIWHQTWPESLQQISTVHGTDPQLVLPDPAILAIQIHAALPERLGKCKIVTANNVVRHGVTPRNQPSHHSDLAPAPHLLPELVENKVLILDRLLILTTSPSVGELPEEAGTCRC